MEKEVKRLKLHGFNNLTKSLSFNMYDICYTKTVADREAYLQYIDEQYNADRLTEILTNVSNIIGANILNIAKQDYEPQGASVTILIAEGCLHSVGAEDNSSAPGPLPETVLAHLDKSHITVHTIDYRVRGFTRDITGHKLFIDHNITSIQDYIPELVKEHYQMIDVNVYQENIFHTKCKLKDFDLDNYLFGLSKEQLHPGEVKRIEAKLRHEMDEIFYGKNMDRINL